MATARLRPEAVCEARSIPADEIGYASGLTTHLSAAPAGNLSVTGRALARAARRRHRSAMSLDDRLDDRQTEAAAGRLPRARRIGLVEAIEDVRQMLGAMPEPVSLTVMTTSLVLDAAFSATLPARGVCRSAFAARFCSACSSRSGSPDDDLRARSDVRRQLTPFCSAARPWRATTRPNRSSSGTSCTRTSRRRLRAAPDRADRRRCARRAASRRGRSRDSARECRDRGRRVHRQRLEIAAHAGQRRHQLVRHVGEQQAPRAIGGRSCSARCCRSRVI